MAPAREDLAMRRRRTPNERRQLADDVRRTAGFMAVVVGEAGRLDLEIPEDVVAAVVAWRVWAQALADLGGDD
jgi:hypothetical protein